MKKTISLLLALFITAMGINLTACSNAVNNGGTARIKDDRNLSEFQYSLYNLAGTDALGRKISISGNAKTDKTRYVGLFYSLWLGQHQEVQSDIYNITYLLESQEGTQALYSTENSELSKMGEFHFWGEPLYGYYNMKDPFVVTRHIELLTMAGIDYLCFDATNAKVYKDSTDLVLDTLLNFQSQGFNVPKIVFYTNSFSGSTVRQIYNLYYQTEKYASLWFEPNGKPLIIGITENNNKASDQTKYAAFTDYIAQEFQEFFDVKESEWPNGDYNENSIPWMSWEYPQNIHSGSIAVPVAQHSHSAISVSYMHPESSRGYNNATRKVEKDFRAGRSFQTMWDTVFANDDKINNVLATSFNEWMAIKYASGSDVFFVDVFNEEFSRDIEMMKGGYNDNFYLQLVSNVKKYKYTQAVKYEYQKMTIDINNAQSMLQWDYVNAAYRDFAGDAILRNYSNATGTGVYTDSSCRNDITDIKVVHDNTNLYFMVKTLKDITAYNGTDLNWMNILLSVDSGDTNSFAGYQYIINRSPKADGTTAIEKSSGGYNFTQCGTAKYTVKGNVMQVAIPLSSLNLTADNCSIEFKVADNVTDYGDIMDYYVTGDSAPLGRLGFSYGY